ncbi:MAG: hypothetical protein A3F72_01070 [Bacteroidetes bacterium RIFCSPLOWO2_12_FULL_35_15]|nr:MAG: hypothetical protein A3F72_01070 [Bacteroidetes bacterium RIFCSPLOWO2_12_FULL_35_15]
MQILNKKKLNKSLHLLFDHPLIKRILRVKKRINYFLIAGISILSACSTDLEVIGNYKETLVVYGLLDQSQPKQYIKINKAFLGEGNAFAYAQIKDSVQFINSLSVRIKRLSDGSEYNLSPDNTVPKDPGTFYGPDQSNAIYSFASAPGMINTSSDYQLIIKNNETGTEVSSKTSLVTDAIITSPPNNLSPVGFVIPTNNNYNFHVNWTTGKNAKIYQLIIRFNYIDSTSTGNIANSLDWFFPEQTTNDIKGGEQMAVEFRGQEFLHFIGTHIVDDPNVLRRIPGKVDFLLISAGEELHTYMEVNKPSTGIIQEKPVFTNITNGLGIFSARLNKAPLSKPLKPNTTNSSATLDSISGGQYTCTLRFLDNINGAGVWTGCH